MGSLDARTTAFARVPAAGGSGGGGPNKNLFPTPEPQAILGLNSTVVYGSNVQVAFPTNFQLALGSNLQVCISPNAWQTLYAEAGSSPVPPSLNGLLGSGLGGNMQLTMGTSANFVIGQSFDINLGPRRITLDVHNKTGIQACVRGLGTAIMAVTTVFLIAYPLAADDDARAWIVIAFQFLMQTMLINLMDLQAIYHHMDAYYKNALDTVYSADPDKAAKDNSPDKDAFGTTFTAESEFGAALQVTGVALAMVLPVLLEIRGEVRLDTPDPSETDGGSS
jgi:hypothetical protein